MRGPAAISREGRSIRTYSTGGRPVDCPAGTKKVPAPITPAAAIIGVAARLFIGALPARTILTAANAATIVTPAEPTVVSASELVGEESVKLQDTTAAPTSTVAE